MRKEMWRFLLLILIVLISYEAAELLFTKGFFSTVIGLAQAMIVPSVFFLWERKMRSIRNVIFLGFFQEYFFPVATLLVYTLITH